MAVNSNLRRSPDMGGYLRVDTTNLGSKPDRNLCRGLMTPISSACSEGRRSSTVSMNSSIDSSMNWSFMSKASTSPNTLSVTSLQSGMEPVTPPQQGSQQYALLSSVSPYGDSSMGGIANGFKPVYLDSQATLQSSPIGPHGAYFHLAQDWDYSPHEHAGIQQPALPFFPTDLMPATRPFRNALGPSLMQQAHTSNDCHGLGSMNLQRQWEHERVDAPFCPTSGLRGDFPFDHDQEMGLQYNFDASTLPSNTQPEATTIVPAATVMRMYPPTDSHMEDLQLPGSGLLSPLSDEYDFRVQGDISETNNEQTTSGDEDWRATRTMVVSQFGAKGIKKEAKSPSSACSRKSKSGAAIKKRRARHTKPSNRSVRSLNGHDVDISFQPRRSPAKHACQHNLSNGEPCHRAFERPEHLKRHENTHKTGEDTVKIPCPCYNDKRWKCEREFPRRDNWRYHLRTHLSKSSAGRNERMEFDEMYSLLRMTESPAEVAKTIMSLETWRKTDGHLKTADSFGETP